MKRSRFFGDFANELAARIEAKRISKVEYVRNVGSGPIGPFMSKDEVLALVPSMHGQRIGRIATIVAAGILTIATTGVSPEYAGPPESVPTPHLVSASSVSTIELVQQ